MADGELFTVFVNSAPALPLPAVATDRLVVTRGGVAYNVPPTDLPRLALGPTVYVSPLTGATIVAVPGQGAFGILPGAALAALTVQLPPGEFEGQVFEASTSEDISAVTVTPNPTNALYGTQGALGTLGGGGGFSFRYRAAANMWIRRY